MSLRLRPVFVITLDLLPVLAARYLPVPRERCAGAVALVVYECVNPCVSCKCAELGRHCRIEGVEKARSGSLLRRHELPKHFGDLVSSDFNSSTGSGGAKMSYSASRAENLT